MNNICINTASFWRVFHMRPGSARRKALKAHFLAYPGGRLPVNNKWQASTKDADLAQLIKKGVLVQTRDGGGRRHPLNRSSAKRQTFLVLAPVRSPSP